MVEASVYWQGGMQHAAQVRAKVKTQCSNTWEMDKWLEGSYEIVNH